MTKEEINEINLKCPSEQGIFSEPYGIPVHIKEPVIYLRHETGGYRGGSYHEDSYARRYEVNTEPNWACLDLVLEKLVPHISYLQYKNFELNVLPKLTHTNEETDYEYYGNSTDYEIKYIILSELEAFLKDI